MFKDSQLKPTFIAIILVAFITGGIAGTLGGALIGSKITENTKSQKTRNHESTENSSALLPDFNEAGRFESNTIQVVEQSAPAVVSVIVTKELERIRSGRSFSGSPFGDFFEDFPGFEEFFGSPRFRDEAPPPDTEQADPIERQVGAGSGFVVSEDGLIITNRHVVDDKQASYSVVTNEGEEFEAEVLARDPILDLAILQVDPGDYELHTLELADSDKIKIGQTVIAIGNSLGEFSNSVTKGVVSGMGRTIVAGGLGSAEVIEEAIQTDAAINPGNSGGPLLDLSGRVVGVNTAVSRQGQSIGFAIPINEAKRIIDSVEQYGRIVRPFLGVRHMLLNERMAELNDLDVNEGALVVRGETQEELAVMPGSPADKAGLEENDIILEVNGTKINRGKSLARVLAKYQPGDTVTLKVLHDGKEKEVEVTLEEFEERE